MTSVAPGALEPSRSEVLARLLSGEETDVLELAAKTGLSQSTVFRSVDELLKVPHLLERRIARQGGRGRPTTKIVLNRRFALLAAVALDSQTTRFAITDALGGAMGERHIETPPHLTGEALADWITTQVENLRADLGEGAPLGALAVGIPGALSRDKTRVVGSLNLPVITGAAFVSRLSAGLGVPVRFENDSHLALLGELSYGSVDRAGTAVLVTMSTGLSAAIAVEGEILVGDEGSLGEFGRLPLTQWNLRLEDLLSEAGLSEVLRADGVATASSAGLAAWLAASPDTRARVDEAFEHLLAIIALAYEPHTIMVTGSFAGLFDDQHLAELSARVAHSVLVECDIRRADLGDDSTVLGAVALASAALFEEFGVRSLQPPSAAPTPVESDAPALDASEITQAVGA